MASSSRYMVRQILLGGALSLLLPVAAMSQGAGPKDSQTLADIRQELSVLYSSVSRLKTELSTTGGLTSGVSGVTPLDRLNAIEAELQRLTAQTERLEFQINTVVRDGTNRVSDLEFRLCELEEGCDISQLEDTPSLGYVDDEAYADEDIARTPSFDDRTDFAVGEQSAVSQAQEALSQGEPAQAVQILQEFSQTYPGSPLAQSAYILLGNAHRDMKAPAEAARAYLAAFSEDTAGPQAPEALYLLGVNLNEIGQSEEACITLEEVVSRYPNDSFALQAQQTRDVLLCP